MMEKLVVHNIITCNILETSHAYTYIKTNIRNNDGRVDTEALKYRYQNPDIQDMYINEKKTLVLMSYVRTYTKIPKLQGSTYDRGGTWKPVRKKYGQARRRSPNELKIGSTRGRLSYLWQGRRSDTNSS